MDAARADCDLGRSYAGAGRRDRAAVSRLALFQRRRADRAAFTEQAVNRVRADETTVKQLMKFMSPREVVELIVAIGYYVMMARFTELMRTDLDPSTGTKIMDTLHR